MMYATPGLWKPSWTLWSGCGAWALGNTRRLSARTRLDEKVLPSLTAEDLKEIGVGPVGHRRMLLEAIAALRADAGARRPPLT